MTTSQNQPKPTTTNHNQPKPSITRYPPTSPAFLYDNFLYIYSTIGPLKKRVGKTGVASFHRFCLVLIGFAKFCLVMVGFPPNLSPFYPKICPETPKFPPRNLTFYQKCDILQLNLVENNRQKEILRNFRRF